jgi:hypothetical protein
MPAPKQMDNEVKGRLGHILSRYKAILRDELAGRQLNPAAFSLFQPYNLFQAVDRSQIHLVFSFDRASEGMVHVRSTDLSEFGEIPGPDLLAQVRHELGFRQVVYLRFPRDYVDLADSELEKRLGVDVRRNIEEEIQHIVRQAQALLPEVEQALPEFMKRASEDEFIECVFIPILHQMGFRRAKAKGHKDRTLEYGNDIREMKWQLPTGHFLYFAAQVKAGDIIYGVSKPSQNVEKLLTEARMAFEKTIFDPEINRDVRVDHVFIVASGQINEGARSYLLERISGEKRRNLLFLDCDDVIGLARQFGLPEVKQKVILAKPNPS